MGPTHTAGVDPAALRAAAREYDTAADIIDIAVRTHLSGLRFAGATAGRCHSAHGDAMRARLEALTDVARQWSRACAEVSAALRASADRYIDADAGAARRLA